jgi:hypothetical protein
MSKPGGGIQLKLGQLKVKSSKPKAQQDDNNNINLNNSANKNSFEETFPTNSNNHQLAQSLSSLRLTAECNLAEKIREKRLRNYRSVLSVPFNMRRTRVLSQTKSLPLGSNGILYWMSREQRVQGLLKFITKPSS